MGLPYERAEMHNCPDGNVCLGHTVDVEYVKINGVMSRNTKCSRCGSSCETEQVNSSFNYKIGGK